MLDVAITVLYDPLCRLPIYVTQDRASETTQVSRSRPNSRGAVFGTLLLPNLKKKKPDNAGGAPPGLHVSAKVRGSELQALAAERIARGVLDVVDDARRRGGRRREDVLARGHARLVAAAERSLRLELHRVEHAGLVVVADVHDGVVAFEARAGGEVAEADGRGEVLEERVARHHDEVADELRAQQVVAQVLDGDGAGDGTDVRGLGGADDGRAKGQRGGEQAKGTVHGVIPYK